MRNRELFQWVITPIYPKHQNKICLISHNLKFWLRFFLHTRGLQSYVVYLSSPIAPSNMSPNAGGGGWGFAGSQPMSTAVHRKSNKLWRSSSIFNLCCAQMTILLCRYLQAAWRPGRARQRKEWTSHHGMSANIHSLCRWTEDEMKKKHSRGPPSPKSAPFLSPPPARHQTHPILCTYGSQTKPIGTNRGDITYRRKNLSGQNLSAEITSLPISSICVAGRRLPI